LIVAAAGCGPEADDLQLPPIPIELQEVALEYVNPTGTVPENATQEIEDAALRLDLISQTRLAELMSDALAALRTRLEGSDLSTDPDGAVDEERPIIEAQARLDRTCRGWDDASTTPNVADGSLQMFAQISQSRLTHQVWGTASACRGRVNVVGDAVVHTYLDGSLAIYLTGRLPTGVRDANFIMAFDGTIGTERTGQTALTFDFLFAAPQVQVRIPVADGVIIGSVGLNEITLRGTNGTFGCSRETHTCTTL
jgi:hypothetical protein